MLGKRLCAGLMALPGKVNLVKGRALPALLSSSWSTTSLWPPLFGWSSSPIPGVLPSPALLERFADLSKLIAWLTKHIPNLAFQVQETLASRSAYFHMAAWSLPLVLTILVMATNNVDGSAVSGICYVGYSSRTARAMFVLVPHTISLLVAAFFTWRCVNLLASLCHGPGSEHLSTAALSKLRSTLTRISVFSVMVAACVFCTLVCHIYRWVNEDSWDAALHKLVLCNLEKQLSPEQSSKCSMDDRPSLGMVQLELLAFCATGVLAASWVCTKESFNTWVIGIRQLVCRLPSQRPVKLRKHEIIAQVKYLKSKGPGSLKGLVKLWTICRVLVLPGLQMDSKADHDPHAN